MGIPSFYRWLAERYPRTVVNAIDEGEGCGSGDSNPNGEFDNLYLDMNGIIHPCFHPDDELFPPSSFDEVFFSIFEYIDRLIRIVRPRKLLYMAVGAFPSIPRFFGSAFAKLLYGVAPRAKMNQQRVRRYRAAKDAEIAEKEEEKLRREFESEGKELLPKQEYSEVSDSNVITPGTIFMQKLSKALEYYIRLKLNNDSSWKSIMVILSDANVPGEGEHKIMSFIRLQRRLPDYNPNTRHCLYGADADLIILALATHEIHICILREDVLKREPLEICLSTFVANSSQKDLGIFKSRQWFKKFETVSNGRINKKKPFQFLNIWILREYLELDMKPRFEADIERIVDDFIFICFFAGNDFLPHLPSIEIHENGIDLLIAVYKKMLMSMGDYLIDASKINKRNTSYINFKGFKSFIMEVGSYESRIFEKRYTLRQKKLQRLMQEREKDENDRIIFCNSEFNPMQEDFNCTIKASEHASDSFTKKCNISTSPAEEASCSVTSDALENTKEFKRRLKQFLRDKADLFKNEVVENDRVKLGCPGWKTRYYKEKFSAENANEIEAIRKELVKKYFEGLCWVLQYYFTGICSWCWYYPFYYGPFASDFKDLYCAEASFAIGRPFRPFDQLMAVLPPRSSHALPEAYRSLMNDDNSPIVHFYPNDFAVDNDGKRYTWQGVCKLPFIEGESLLGATKALLKELQPDEIERNCFKSDKVFIMDSNPLVKKISLQHQLTENHPKETQNQDIVVPRFGTNGFLTFCENSSAPSNFNSPLSGMKDISNDRTRCATLIKQEIEAHFPGPLEGVKIPEKTITDADIVERVLWHEYPGHFPPQPLQQRYVQTLPEAANETSKGAEEGWGSVGRRKLVLDSSIASPGEKWKKVAEHLASVGRGEVIVDRTFAGSGKEIWKGGGQGWKGMGRGKLLVDRTLAGPGKEKPSCVFPATPLNMKEKGDNRNTYYSAAPAPAPASTSKFYGNFQHMDERWTARRSDDWRQRSEPMVSAYGRGRGRTPSNSHGSEGGRGHGRKGDLNFMWVPRKVGQSDGCWRSSASMAARSGLGDGGDGGEGKEG